MKKNKLIYLIFTLITIFSFNMEANAAQELTCLYEKGSVYRKILLIQYSNGKIEIYKNDKDAGIDEIGWKLAPNEKIYLNSRKKDEGEKPLEGNLTQCPAAESYLVSDDTVTLFFEKEINDYYESPTQGTTIELDDIFGNLLDKDQSYNKIVKPVLTPEVGEKEYNGKYAGKSCGTINKEDKWLKDLDTSQYTGSCLYEYNIGDTGCHIIQVDFSAEKVRVIESEPNTNFVIHPFQIDSGFNAKAIKEDEGGNCIDIIRVNRKERMDKGELEISTTVYFNINDYEKYAIIDVRGKNSVTGEDLVLEGPSGIIINPGKKIESCEDLIGEEMSDMLNTVWKLIRIIIPIVLIGLGTMDFAKAVFSGNEDDMKKITKKFVKRLLIAVVIFLIPSILGLLLKMGNEIWGDTIGTDLCGILF